MYRKPLKTYRCFECYHAYYILMIKQWGKLWGKHRVKQIRLFGSFFAVKCTNRLSANQAVITVKR